MRIHIICLKRKRTSNDDQNSDLYCFCFIAMQRVGGPKFSRTAKQLPRQVEAFFTILNTKWNTDSIRLSSTSFFDHWLTTMWSVIHLQLTWFHYNCKLKYNNIFLYSYRCITIVSVVINFRIQFHFLPGGWAPSTWQKKSLNTRHCLKHALKNVDQKITQNGLVAKC